MHVRGSAGGGAPGWTAATEPDTRLDAEAELTIERGTNLTKILSSSDLARLLDLTMGSPGSIASEAPLAQQRILS